MPDQPPFRLLPLLSAVLLMALGISFFGQWHGQNPSLARHCEDPAATLEQLRRLLTEQRPAGDDFEARRPYISASRLLFLLPQQSGESDDAYLQRLRAHLATHCR